MIKGALFLLVVIAVVWLGLWTARAEKGKPGRIAPFDMREPRPRTDRTGPFSRPRPVRWSRAPRARHPE